MAYDVIRSQITLVWHLMTVFSHAVRASLLLNRVAMVTDRDSGVSDDHRSNLAHLLRSPQ